MLTQIVRYGRMLKANLGEIRCQVSAHWTSDGSVFAGTIASRCHSVEVRTEIESDDDPALIAAVVRNAEGGCYAEAALREPVPIHKSVVLNGDAFDYENYPRKVNRR
ncbi:MAG: OsmC family protein [Acidimicrobiia bacterium]